MGTIRGKSLKQGLTSAKDLPYNAIRTCHTRGHGGRYRINNAIRTCYTRGHGGRRVNNAIRTCYTRRHSGRRVNNAIRTCYTRVHGGRYRIIAVLKLNKQK